MIKTACRMNSMKNKTKTKKYKFKPAHLGMRCNVPYIYTATIVGFYPERKMVKVYFNYGPYDRIEVFVPEKDINLEPNE